jgi:hypothetical protein
MKRAAWVIIKYPMSRAILLLLTAAALTMSCAGMDPRNVDVEVKKAPPETKVTSFSKSLVDLGRMTEIYDTPRLNIQSKDIVDNTGTSVATGAEIPRDITEMIKSSLNAIGGKVVFIPYNPGFIQNQMITGYSNFDKKLIPDVVITGGITEFDRGLETRGKNIDIGAETKPWTGAPKSLPGNTIGIDYGKEDKEAFSSVTLDFNLIDFQTMAGIARMQTVNSIKVHKAMAESELGFTLFGPTFGLKGSVKKVQGRHAAVRLLVELSMIQIIGKYLMVPYWKLLPDAEPDPVVIEGLTKAYYQFDEPSRIAKAQEMLILHGYDVPLNGILDEQTRAALQKTVNTFDPASNGIDKETFVALYLSVPIADSTLERRYLVSSLVSGGQENQQAAVAPPAEPQGAAAEPTQPPAPTPAAASAPHQEQNVQASAPKPEPAAQAAGSGTDAGSERKIPQEQVKRKTMVGRMLKDNEW